MAQAAETMRHISAYLYEGGNEYIDHLLEEGERWYIVSGVNGRRPIQADTMKEAIAIYVERDSKWDQHKKAA